MMSQSSCDPVLKQKAHRRPYNYAKEEHQPRRDSVKPRPQPDTENAALPKCRVRTDGEFKAAFLTPGRIA